MKGAVFYVKGSAFFMLSVITLVPLNVAKLLIYKMQKCCFFCPPGRQQIRQHWSCCSKCCSLCPLRRQQILNGVFPQPYSCCYSSLTADNISEHYRHIALRVDIDYALREQAELRDNGERRECERHERVNAFINTQLSCLFFHDT